MGNIVVDDVSRVLSEADKEPKCPKCGSTKFLVSYNREFIAYMDKEESSETIDSNPDPYYIGCMGCGETIW